MKTPDPRGFARQSSSLKTIQFYQLSNRPKSWKINNWAYRPENEIRTRAVKRDRVAELLAKL